MIDFPLAGIEDDLTRLPGHRVRRFYLLREGRQGRLHFFNGIPTAVVLDLDRDEQHVLEWLRDSPPFPTGNLPGSTSPPAPQGRRTKTPLPSLLRCPSPVCPARESDGTRPGSAPGKGALVPCSGRTAPPWPRGPSGKGRRPRSWSGPECGLPEVRRGSAVSATGRARYAPSRCHVARDDPCLPRSGTRLRVPHPAAGPVALAWIAFNAIRGTWFLVLHPRRRAGPALTSPGWTDLLLLPVCCCAGWSRRSATTATSRTAASRPPAPCQFLLACLCCANLQRGPLWWAAIHRHHHRHSDEPADAHSPVQGGFLWAYCGWMFATLEEPDWGTVRDLTPLPRAGLAGAALAGARPAAGGAVLADRRLEHGVPGLLPDRGGRPARRVGGQLAGPPGRLAPLRDARRQPQQPAAGAAHASGTAGTTTTTTTRTRPRPASSRARWTAASG